LTFDNTFSDIWLSGFVCLLDAVIIIHAKLSPLAVTPKLPLNEMGLGDTGEPGDGIGVYLSKIPPIRKERSVGLGTNNDFDQQQIECPRCGEEVYYELTRCPNCGLNFYLTDQQGDWWEGERNVSEERAPWLDVSIVGLLLGWLVSGMMAFGVHYLIAQVFRSSSPSFIPQILIIFVNPAGAFIGGWVAIAFAERNAILHGIALGLFSIGDAILLEAYWRDLSYENLIRGQTILGWGLTLLAALLATSLYMKRAQRDMVKALFFPDRAESRLYEELYVKVGYDRDRVERLIDYERQRAPKEGRAELIERAIQRWNRDNR
jgi:ribosomal protein L37E